MLHAIVIWGASGHARVVADAARLQNQYSVAGFLDDNPDRKGMAFESSLILGGRDQLTTLLDEGVRGVHVAIGQCRARVALSDIAEALGFSLATVVHPGAIIARDVPISPGSFVAAGAIVNSGASIGRGVILNTSCSVDHECNIDDGVHIGPGARLGGQVRVGREAWVAMSATILNGRTVGANSIVGAGAVVTTDVPAGVVAYGVPARVIRMRRHNE